MSVQVLRDKSNKVLGRITTESSGLQILRDASNMRLGTYDPRDNVTRDHRNMRVGTGNLLATLLRG